MTGGHGDVANRAVAVPGPNESHGSRRLPSGTTAGDSVHADGGDGAERRRYCVLACPKRASRLRRLLLLRLKLQHFHLGWRDNSPRNRAHDPSRPDVKISTLAGVIENVTPAVRFFVGRWEKNGRTSMDFNLVIVLVVTVPSIVALVAILRKTPVNWGMKVNLFKVIVETTVSTRAPNDHTPGAPAIGNEMAFRPTNGNENGSFCASIDSARSCGDVGQRAADPESGRFPQPTGETAKLKGTPS
jgi:hypothetical protein